MVLNAKKTNNLSDTSHLNPSYHKRDTIFFTSQKSKITIHPSKYKLKRSPEERGWRMRMAIPNEEYRWRRWDKWTENGEIEEKIEMKFF